MAGRALSSETIHATSVAIAGRCVLIAGLSGSGKSDLALRLIDRGAELVSDDYTIVRRAGAALMASAPPRIAGRIEVRGIGIVEMPALAEAPVALIVTLDAPIDRMPPEPAAERWIAGIALPVTAIAAFEASAPIKVELALRRLEKPA